MTCPGERAALAKRIEIRESRLTSLDLQLGEAKLYLRRDGCNRDVGTAQVERLRTARHVVLALLRADRRALRDP